MTRPLSFEITARSRVSRARVGRVCTPHGVFDTPAFMPVGTRGTVRGLVPDLLRRTGTQILLANTYHLLVRPGAAVVERLGGIHRFMGWTGPVLTDSGGYQAYSLAEMRQIGDDGVTFRSVADGSRIHLTPEQAVHAQNAIGADIIMPLDDCPPALCEESGASVSGARSRRAGVQAGNDPGSGCAARVRQASERTVRWLERSIRAHGRRGEQALFGIVQGGTDEAQRQWCAERVTAFDLPGYAIGGVAVGEPSDEIERIVRVTAAMLPEDRPRYLMGVGYEGDLVSAVLAGVDMFDCVLPTRNGRNATAFTSRGRVRLRNACHRDDRTPIEPGCDCPVCDPGRHGWDTPGGAPFSRGYLRHLFQAGEMLGPILVSLHNVRYFQRLMVDMRAAISNDDWAAVWVRWPVLRPALARAGLGGSAP